MFKTDRRVKVINNSANHGVANGTILTYIKCIRDGHNKHFTKERPEIYFYDTDLQSLEGEETQNELQTELESLTAKVDEIKNKLSWMRETNTTLFDERQYKIYNIIKTFKEATINLFEDSSKKINYLAVEEMSSLTKRITNLLDNK